MPIFEEIKTNIINNHSNEIYTHGETINLLRTYNFDNNYFSIKYTTDPQGLIDNSGKVVGTHVGPVTVTAKIEFGTLVQNSISNNNQRKCCSTIGLRDLLRFTYCHKW